MLGHHLWGIWPLGSCPALTCHISSYRIGSDGESLLALDPCHLCLSMGIGRVISSRCWPPDGSSYPASACVLVWLRPPPGDHFLLTLFKVSLKLPCIACSTILRSSHFQLLIVCSVQKWREKTWGLLPSISQHRNHTSSCLWCLAMLLILFCTNKGPYQPYKTY